MSSIEISSESCSASCGCHDGVSRREVLKALGAGVVASTVPGEVNAFAGPFSGQDAEDHLIPADKKLAPEWIASLTDRGTPEVFSGAQLKYIGMPIGGVGCGQLYLGGDGRLWHWDIFKCNYRREPGHRQSLAAFSIGGHYAHPVAQGEEYTARNGAEVQQGFLIRTSAGTRTLDWHGFPGVVFRGEYPVGKVKYAEAGFPVEIELKAFSPFIPLNAKDSAIPATVMRFTITNTTDAPTKVDLGGWMQNATCPYTSDESLGQRQNKILQTEGRVSVVSTVGPQPDDSLREIESKHGYGSMALTLLHDTHEAGLELTASTALTDPDSPAGLFEQAGPITKQEQAAKPLNELLVGGLFAAFELRPGESRTVDFAITWFFPDYNEVNQDKGRNDFKKISGFPALRRHYAAWFDSADKVAEYLCQDKQRLLDGTLAWNATWYDSSLPHWLLDRAFIPLACVATQTFHWFDNGRPYGWEGVDCCPGTCTHVWHYAQALGRVFPEIERAFREKVDFEDGIGFNPTTGLINYRAENNRKEATDGQAGTILRAYREHQMSADSSFLQGIWPKVKKAVEYLIRQDTDRSGMLRGRQPHTLDAAWYGPMGWLSGMYLASLAAGEAMASEMGDDPFARQCRDLIDRGKENFVRELFDGEYFIHKVDPTKKALNVNRGCHIDQVLGQAWAHQVGLGRVIPKAETISALNSLWKYNFAPDAGRYALDHVQIEQAFRWYAMPGEAGLLMCTWPKGGAAEAIPGGKLRTKDNPKTFSGFGGYFNECMNGFEYQVAAHMIFEGEPDSESVLQGLAIMKAVHERYSADKRNPYNEIECSDHYARSMASYGGFLAACGFDYHGPKGLLRFSPRIKPNQFKAPFITAEGWGSYEQRIEGDKVSAQVSVKHGSLSLSTLAIGGLPGAAAESVKVSIDGTEVEARLASSPGEVSIHFPHVLQLETGQDMRASLFNS